MKPSATDLLQEVPSGLPPDVLSPESHWHPPVTGAEAATERTALRWRGTLLRLSDCFTAAAAAHPELAPVLLESLGNALEQLLLFGRERDLSLLEEWLDEENS